MNQYRSLSAFPENRRVLQALQAQGVPTGILSNGDVAMPHVGTQEQRSAPVCGTTSSARRGEEHYRLHPAVYALGESTLACPHPRFCL